jgi:hypothetical protein
MLHDDLDAVKSHIEAWRRVRTGEVIWKSLRFRAAADPLDVPVRWKLARPSEWLEACGDAAMRYEFETMATLVEQTDSAFHSLFVRKRSLWHGKPITEIIQAARVAVGLAPGCAAGRPLRMMTAEGIDTKFFERNAQLVTMLLDIRFDDEASRIGLENFLGAFTEGDHWLLVIDLDGSLLPFKKVRIRSSELRDTMLPGRHLLIVENEACQHHLPAIPNTIAILGCGFDLAWTDGDWVAMKKVGYWGDIDTWGLQFLARARRSIRGVDALMMSAAVFDQFIASAVPEPIVAGEELPQGLNVAEQELYRRLLTEPRGRLEQEFLPVELCREVLTSWSSAQAT